MSVNKYMLIKHKRKQESSYESEEENLSLLSKKFYRFLKRNCNKVLECMALN